MEDGAMIVNATDEEFENLKREFKSMKTLEIAFISTYRGKRFIDMSREELIEALDNMGKAYMNLLESHRKDIQNIIGLRQRPKSMFERLLDFIN